MPTSSSVRTARPAEKAALEALQRRSCELDGLFVAAGAAQTRFGPAPRMSLPVRPAAASERGGALP
jgi:hypothetical protein